MRRLETRVLKFNHMQPVDFLLMLADPTYNPSQPPPLASSQPQKPKQTLIPPGLVSLSPDNLKQELTVLGDPSMIAELEALRRLLDVKVRELTLTLTVGESKAIVPLKNNIMKRITAIAQGKQYTLDVTPHLNGDGTVSFFVGIITTDDLVVINWGDALEGRGGSLAEKGTIATFRRVRFGEPIAFKWGGVTVTLTATPVS
jgi:hypothetical protein